MTQPNILFAFADDWGRYASAYAALCGPNSLHDLIRTPHFDRVAKEVDESFDAFLQARPADKPFCYWWGPTNTHRKWQQGSGKALWGIDPDSLKGRMPGFLPDVHEVREDFADYLGECMFEPDRWPMGDPRGLDDPAVAPPSYEALREDTFAAYADLDSSPTKAWMVHHRAEAEVWPLYELGFGKRPAEELYDVRSDPDHLANLAGRSAYAAVQAGLRDQLLRELHTHGDPRLTEIPCRFERPPFTNGVG